MDTGNNSTVGKDYVVDFFKAILLLDRTGVDYAVKKLGGFINSQTLLVFAKDCIQNDKYLALEMLSKYFAFNDLDKNKRLISNELLLDVLINKCKDLDDPITLKIFDVLINNGAVTGIAYDRGDNKLLSPLHNALNKDLWLISKRILNDEGYPLFPSNVESIISVIARKNNIDCFNLLLKNKGNNWIKDINIPSPIDGSFPLGHAIENKNLFMVKEFLKVNAKTTSLKIDKSPYKKLVVSSLEPISIYTMVYKKIEDWRAQSSSDVDAVKEKVSIEDINSSWGLFKTLVFSKKTKIKIKTLSEVIFNKILDNKIEEVIELIHEKDIVELKAVKFNGIGLVSFCTFLCLTQKTLESPSILNAGRDNIPPKYLLLLSAAAKKIGIEEIYLFDGATPLHVAAIFDNSLAVAEILMNNGYSPSYIPPSLSYSAMHWCVISKNMSVLEYIFDSPDRGDINKKIIKSSFEIAIDMGDNNMAIFLAKKGVVINWDYIYAKKNEGIIDDISFTELERAFLDLNVVMKDVGGGKQKPNKI